MEMTMPTMHWQLSEQAAAIRYRLLAAGSSDGFRPGLVARVGVPSAYVAPLVERAFAIHPAMYTVLDADGGAATRTPADADLPDLIWDEYENLDWKSVLSGKVVANAYCVRKGLSRKAQLSIYLSKYIRKHPSCCLSKALPRTLVVDTWEAFDDSMAQFGISFRQRLDSCLWEVRQAIEASQADGKRWIMKPSATNKGAEVSVVTSFAQLRAIVNEWTDIREWVVQDYIARPLLVRGRKFHIRVYVLALGGLKVFVYQRCLMLTALEQYRDDDTGNAYAHITNTFQQQSHPDFVESECVMLLDDIEEILAEQGVADASAKKHKILGDIGRITAETFDAYKGEFSVFQPLPNCFELYGVDFMVDEDFNVWLLELNPGPDFKQTGSRLNGVIRDLMADTLSIVTDHFFAEASDTVGGMGGAAVFGSFKKVYDEAWGVSKEPVSMKFRE